MPGVENFEISYHPTSEQGGVVIWPQERFMAAVFGGQPVDYRVPAGLVMDVKDAIDAALGDLGERERTVLEERYLRKEKGTLQKIAEELDLSRERVRQIESKALRKVRHPARSRDLREVCPVSEECLGKEIFPYVELMGDIPQATSVPMRDINWSDQAEAELNRDGQFRWEYFNLRKLLAGSRDAYINLDKLSPEVLEEIKQVSKKIVEEGVETVLKPVRADLAEPTPAANIGAEVVTFSRDEEEDEEEEIPAYTYDFGEFDEEEEEEEIPDFSRSVRVAPRKDQAHEEVPAAQKLRPESTRRVMREGEERQKSQLRDLIKEALASGAQNSSEVLTYIASKKGHVSGKRADGWQVKAWVEYLFNHPDEK